MIAKGNTEIVSVKKGTFELAAVYQGSNLVWPTNYELNLSLITSSSTNVGVQLGWQYTNGTNVARPFTLNGTTYNATTTNYWTNSTTVHNYNVIAERNIGNEYVFFVNTANNTANITSANITSDFPAVNMSGTFQSCSNLTSINSGVLNVTNLEATFSSCRNLTSLDGIANWNVSKVTNMYFAFQYCQNITSLDAIANWNVSNLDDMSYTFAYCNKLTSLDDIANWNVPKVTTMSYAFRYCNKLTTLNCLSNWNVNNVNNMYYAFSDCTNLTNIQGILDALANKRKANTRFDGCFRDCNNLSGNIFIRFNYANSVTYMFSGNTYRKNIYAYNGTTTWNSFVAIMTFNSTLNCYENTSWNGRLYSI